MSGAGIKQLWAEERGAAAVYFALIAPLLIAFVVLGSEAGFWLLSQRKVQHIADVAAYSAASRLLRADPGDEVVQTARGTAEASGLKASDSFAANVPPQTSAGFTGQEGYVEVDIARALPQYFSGYLGLAPPVVHGHAVAGALDAGYTVCMLALSTSASPAIGVAGSAEAAFSGCSVATNSVSQNSFEMIGGSVTVTAGCIDTVGDVNVNYSGLTLTDCSAPRTFQRAVADPYEGLALPETNATPEGVSVVQGPIEPGPCEVVPSQPFDASMEQARFVGGVSFKGEVDLCPGLYVIDGGSLSFGRNSVVRGANVVFYLANGASLTIDGTAVLTLSAPASGPYSGVLFFNDPASVSTNNKIVGNASSQIQGVLYLPSGNLDFQGNSGSTNSCMQILASEIYISGNSELSMGCVPDGSRRVATNQTLALVE